MGGDFCISVKEVFTHYAHMFALRDCWNRHDLMVVFVLFLTASFSLLDLGWCAKLNVH